MSASADVIEWDEERTGQRQEGAYGGITSMSIKMAVAITLLMVGPVLSWVGYKPGGSGITPEAGENLRALFALGPAAIYLLSALVFSRYPITRESHRAMRDRLSARSAAAEEEKSKSIAIVDRYCSTLKEAILYRLGAIFCDIVPDRSVRPYRDEK